MCNQGGSSLCMFFHKYNETLMHIVSGYEMLCGMKYLYRHDKIGSYLHWLTLRDNIFRVCKSWLHHVPLSTTTKGNVTIYWDTLLLTDTMAKFNNPDIVIRNATEKTEQLIYIKLPQYYSVVSATANKITKYKDMTLEIQKC